MQKCWLKKQKKIDLPFLKQEELISKIGSYHYEVKNNYQEAISYWQQLLDYQKNINPGNNANVPRLYNKIGWAYRRLEGKENLKKALSDLETALTMNKALFPGNHEETAISLSHIGSVYAALGGEAHLKKGKEYKKEALKMRQALFPGNHKVVADTLNYLGYLYQELGGEENLNKALKYENRALKMRRALFDKNDRECDIAISLNRIGSTYLALGGDKNIQEGLSYSQHALDIRKEILPNNHRDLAVSFDQVGWTYTQLQGKENVEKGLNLLKDALKIRKKIFVPWHPDIETSLNHIGNAYIKLGEKENILKGLKYQEKALKIRQILFFSNHIDVARSLQEIGQIYQTLGDESKNLEYMKQAYGIYSDVFDENHDEARNAKAKIESLQPHFFTNQEYNLTLQYQDCLGGNKVGSECRWIIASQREIKENLIILKQKLQKDILNNIVQAVDDYGWSSLGINGDWGVKGYTEKRYLRRQLERVKNQDYNIELAQMLCFEAMNLGIMKSRKKPYEVVECFTQENLELVKKIAIEHPEFFVDGSIVEACIRAMPNDKSFEEHLLKHVKYMGMEERKAQQEAA